MALHHDFVARVEQSVQYIEIFSLCVETLPPPRSPLQLREAPVKQMNALDRRTKLHLVSFKFLSSVFDK